MTEVTDWLNSASSEMQLKSEKTESDTLSTSGVGGLV